VVLLTGSPTTQADVQPWILLSEFGCEKESKAKVKTGQLKEQIWVVKEGQELTDVFYTLILGYQCTVFIPVRGIYIQSQLVSKFHKKETNEKKKHRKIGINNWQCFPPVASIHSSH